MRVGFLGAGLIATFHSKMLSASGEPFERTGVYDPDRSRAEAFVQAARGGVVCPRVCVRAAGGTIRIGARSAVAANSVLIAVNHKVEPGQPRFNVQWDETRSGIDIGSNVWVGAGCVILPGAVIGDDAVIAAGSVVRGTVPAGEIWGGVPARKIRTIDVATVEERETA